jgi:hypothetical protein
MSTLDDVFWSEDSGHRLVSGRCTSSPTAVEDGVMVKVPSFDEGVDEFGPCAFQPIAGDDGPIYPVDGCQCLVAFDERNAAWVLVFVPAP